jgi:hypothetical protein
MESNDPGTMVPTAAGGSGQPEPARIYMDEIQAAQGVLDRLGKHLVGAPIVVDSVERADDDEAVIVRALAGLTPVTVIVDRGPDGFELTLTTTRLPV